MTDHILDLASGFENGTFKQWLDKTDNALRGAHIDSLIHLSEDGFACGPLFTHDTAPGSLQLSKANIPHLSGRPWHITSEIDHPDIAQANADILTDLNGGASALSLRIDPTGEHGIAVRDRSDLQRLLSSVMTNLVPISLCPSADNFETAALFAEHFQDRKDLADIHISFGYTPSKNDSKKYASLAHWVKTNAPHWQAISIDANRVHEAGATQAQELAYMLSYGVQIIRDLQAHGLGIDDVLPLLDVHLASDQDGHMGIVKLRAARMVWAKMAESFGASDTACTIRATSSRRMLSKMDPWSNMLRLSGATFGAVCGGADYITTLPFTQPLGLATPFARRAARNQQLLLMEESRLGHVSDPARGSYTHETLTHELAKSTWEIFQEMESLGGWAGAQDWFLKQIKSAHEHRMAKIKSGEILLVGVNQFTKPDVRKAEIRPRPKTKPKSGTKINTDDFKTAIGQAKDGCLLALNKQANAFKPVRLCEEIEGPHHE